MGRAQDAPAAEARRDATAQHTQVTAMIFPNVDDAQNIFDLRDMAKRRLPKWLFEFVDRGTEDEVALHNNR